MFDQVLRRLGLTDKDKEYFGMEYEDEQKVPVSLANYDYIMSHTVLGCRQVGGAHVAFKHVFS